MEIKHCGDHYIIIDNGKIIASADTKHEIEKIIDEIEKEKS